MSRVFSIKSDIAILSPVLFADQAYKSHRTRPQIRKREFDDGVFNKYNDRGVFLIEEGEMRAEGEIAGDTVLYEQPQPEPRESRERRRTDDPHGFVRLYLCGERRQMQADVKAHQYERPV